MVWIGAMRRSFTTALRPAQPSGKPASIPLRFSCSPVTSCSRAYSHVTDIPEAASAAGLVKISTLPNGVRVATEATPGHFLGAGVYVDAGSRFESARIRGATHLTDRMAFKSTKHRTAQQMSLEVKRLGGSFTSTSGRDTVMYQATSYPESLPSILSILSDTVLHPLLLPEELEAEKLGAAWEVHEMQKKPEYMLPELLHEVAFKDNTVGLPLVCPEERLPEMTPEVLWEYRQLWFCPERIVVAGVGVEHKVFLAEAERTFGAFKAPRLPSASLPSYLATATAASTSSSSSPISRSYATTASPPVDLTTGRPLQSFEELVSARPRYTGGSFFLDDASDKFAHIYVGFEASGVHDPDLYALACLHIMLGGGSSFSAGGPGKGMYSRLYTGVLNQHYDVDFCQAFHHCYKDTGLFGMAISVAPEFAGKVPQLVAMQLDSITRAMPRGGIREEEMRRAKNQLKSSLMFGLESRQLQVEDLGRQVQVSGKKTSLEEMSAKIDALTIADLHRAASRVLRPSPGPCGHSGEPTIVGMGKLHGLGDIKAALARYGIGSPEGRSAR